ncbi:hypothetical protein [Methylobacterium frigidaeris]|uniref:Uncharacterized protein n=1 Tax=Methylobacterium frigidaeris TaxID=2038277 RepID=A0AA37M7I6_9HYPH|nr:hypothetical protein [Methylobacterium frigidaeris]GJD66023.1 hypothetical protein MPEAHAMD_6219 [Methylobacterium frigidaeris]
MVGILAIWNDCAPEGREHYERWYRREHLQERVGVPGFRAGHRYEAVDADRRYFTFYEVDDPAVLASRPYLDRLNAPTEWTRQAMRSFRGMVRTVCDVTLSEGDLTGAVAVTLRLSDARPARALARVLAEASRDGDGIARVRLWEAAERQTPPGTREMEGRDGPDASVPAAIVIECLRATGAQAVAARLRQETAESGADAAACAIGIYAHLCSLRRDRA